jgi:CPA2 family monovalent cation:H+ antiporter-2
MNDIGSFLQDFALVLCVAAVTTVVFHKLKQPTVLGYLLAGIILGPHVKIPLFAHEDTIKTLAQLGVILVMFSIGLKFSIRRLVRVLPTAGLTSLIEISVMMWLGYTAGQFMGWTRLESIFAGAIVAISSTMIASKALTDQNSDEKLNRVVFSILVVQDLAAVLMVALLTPLSRGADPSLVSFLTTSGTLFAFLGLILGAGYLVIPFVVRSVVRLRSPETLLVTTIGLCFAMALLAQRGGYSVALGAFLAGMLMAEAGVAPEVERLTNPLRDLFSSVFFVAVGMLVDPSVLKIHWAAVLLLTLVVIVGQIVSVTFGSFISGRPLNTALRTGMSLAQIGEFSYIIAQLGVAQGNVGGYIYDVAVAVSVVTAFTTPWLIRVSDPFARLLDSRLPKPLQTFTTLYGSWLEDLRHGGAEETIWSRSRRLVRSIAMDTFFLAGIVITTASTLKKWVPRLQQYLDLTYLGWRVMLITIGCVIALPFLVGVLRNAKTLAALIATSAIPSVPEGVLDLGQAPRKALSLTLQLGILFAIGFPLMALTQPFLPSGYSPVLFAMLLAFLGVVFWKSAVNLHEHVQAGAQMMAQALSQRVPEKREEAMEQINTMVPGIGAPESVPVPPGSVAVGKTLGELNLRSSIGANVIAIMRGNDRFLMPGGKELLHAGDILVLVGAQQAVRQAKEFLQKNSAL